jgi:hypothetical protein
LIDDCTGDDASWQLIRKTLSTLSDIATSYDQDGIDLAFINSKQYFACLGTPFDVVRGFDSVAPIKVPKCTLKLRIDVMLADYVARFREDRFTKPLNLIVITPGEFSERDEFEETVMKWAKELDMMGAPESQVGLQFVLVGCRKDNVLRFHRLDAKMHEKRRVRYFFTLQFIFKLSKTPVSYEFKGIWSTQHHTTPHIPKIQNCSQRSCVVV